MKTPVLNKIDEIQIQPNAPCPIILSSDNKLYLVFNHFDHAADQLIYCIQFNICWSYKFGLPNMDILAAHQLSQYGLEFNHAYVVEKSSWIDELIEIEKKHPMFKPELAQGLRHYIFTFRDNTFECLAKGYTLSVENKPKEEVLASLLKDIYE